MPQRIQLSRRKGWKKPADAIVVSRPSRWGNPYVVGRNYIVLDELTAPLPTAREAGADNGLLDVRRCESRARAVDWYRRYLYALLNTAVIPEIVTALRGHDLACWCPPGEPCHADVLLEIANV